MPQGTRQLHVVERNFRRMDLDIGEELRRARLNSGLRQADVARAVGASPATVSRVERGLIRGITVERVLRHAAVVGLVGRFGLFPSGAPVRVAGQTRLLGRLRARLGPAWRWRIEVVLALSGDLRAFDAMADFPGCRVGIDAFTRLVDVQAQVRASLLKQRDGQVDRLVLLIAVTNANRRALALARDLLAGSFPLGTRDVLARLGTGSDPGAMASSCCDDRRSLNRGRRLG